jgi:hypothetical protein
MTALLIKRIVRVALVIGSVGVAVGLPRIAIDLHRTARVEHLAAKVLEASHVLLDECRWERPAVGGPSRECNAAEVANVAVNHLFADAPVGAIANAELLRALREYRAPPEDIEGFLATHTDALAAVRDSTRCSWSCVREAPHIAYRHGSFRDAMALLLLQARASPPRTCLAIGIDVVRLAEDDTVGLSDAIAFSRPMPDDIPALAQRTLVECAARADAATIEEAARDALVVAKSPKPVGDALALCATILSGPMISDVSDPKRVGAGNVLWVQRGYVLDAAESELALIPSLRAYRGEDYPALFDRLERDLPPLTWIPLAHYGEQDWQGATGNRLAVARDGMRELLLVDALFARRIRLMGVALAALRDRIDRGAWPTAGPTELSDPALRDPLVGAPFRWSLDGTRAILAADATTGDREAPAEALTLVVAASP